jgi:hypothetical protein
VRVPRALRAFVAVAILAAVAAVSGCGSTPTPASTPTVSAAASPTPVSPDPCVVGAWRSTVGMLPELYHGGPVTVTGGGGVVLKYNAEGSYTGDFSKAQPYTATTPDGHKLSVLATGMVAGSFTAAAGELTLSDTQTTLTVTERVDGTVISTAAASRTSSAEYMCAPGHLTLSSGGFATQYLPAT